MKDDVRTACLALVKGDAAPQPGRAPRPLALGWKLENGLLPTSELDALYEAFRDDAQPADPWTTSGPLRALLVEYQAVLRGGSRCRVPRLARRGRPAHSA